MKKKILLIDDEKDTCNTLTKILAEEGYQAFSALSGQSGLNRVKKQKPDLVLLDIKMPKMDGIEVLHRIKEMDPGIVVIMITAYGTLDTAKDAMRLRAYDYITKPFDLKLMKTIVKRALLKRTKESRKAKESKNLKTGDKKGRKKSRNSNPD